MKITVGSLFSGIGGLDLGLERAGMQVLWQSEIDPYASKILKKHWPDVINYGNIKEINGKELPPVSLICGGFPCQDLSYAGKRKGLDGSRSGLFYEMSRVISEAKPKYILFENVPGLITKAMGPVMQEIRFQGYIPLRPVLVEAASIGAPHRRERIFILAYQPPEIKGNPPPTNSHSLRPYREEANDGEQSSEVQPTDKQISIPGSVGEDVANSISLSSRMEEYRNSGQERTPTPTSKSKVLRQENGPFGSKGSGASSQDVFNSKLSQATRQRENGGESDLQSEPEGFGLSGLPDWWTVEPDVGRVAHGIPSRVDRLRCLGNAVVPQVGEYIGRMIIEFDKLNNPL